MVPASDAWDASDMRPVCPVASWPSSTSVWQVRRSNRCASLLIVSESWFISCFTTNIVYCQHDIIYIYIYLYIYLFIYLIMYFMYIYIYICICMYILYMYIFVFEHAYLVFVLSMLGNGICNWWCLQVRPKLERRGSEGVRFMADTNLDFPWCLQRT